MFAVKRKEKAMDIVKITVSNDFFSRKIPRLAIPTPFSVMTVR
jgi:hypothetical protein